MLTTLLLLLLLSPDCATSLLEMIEVEEKIEVEEADGRGGGCTIPGWLGPGDWLGETPFFCCVLLLFEGRLKP